MSQDVEPQKDNSWSDSFSCKDTRQLRYDHTIPDCLPMGMMSCSTVTIGEGMITADIRVSYGVSRYDEGITETFSLYHCCCTLYLC